MQFAIGSIIRFTYSHQSVDANTGDEFKECLVLHPSWHNKVHCVDLKRLSPAQRVVLEAILDPEDADKPHRIPMVNDIRRKMDPVQLIQNPVAFYARFLKPFLRKTDAYRQYIPRRMTGVTVVKDAAISTGKAPVAHPLFPTKAAKPIPPKPTPPPLPGKATTVKGFTPPQPPATPIDIMARAQTQRTPFSPPKPPSLPKRGKVIRGKVIGGKIPRNK